MLDKVRKTTQIILDSTHSRIEKKQIKQTSYSLQFACPYCFDSDKNPRKKRANIYIDTMSFHCFNCGMHKSSVLYFFNDFNQYSNLNYDDIEKIDTISKQTKQKINIDLFNKKKINEISINRDDLKKNFRLVEVNTTKAEYYLFGRCQRKFEYFLYDEEKDGVWVLNLTPDGKIMGAQVRSLWNKYSKYTTHSISDIHEVLNTGMDVSKYDRLSLTFNVLNVDYTKMVKVLEGPFDAYLLKNAIAIGGLFKELVIEVSNMVYIYDNDTDGKNAAIDKLNKGKRVFLWDKFLSEHKELKINGKKKVDITDVAIAANKNDVKINKFDKYYSTSPYDLYFL